MGDKKGLRNIILIFIGVLVAIIISLIFLNKKNNNIIQDENNNETISNKNAFCISDNRGKYAVFNAVGKQITKFDFSNECDFYNGSSVVKNDDGQYGIINTSGKFVVKYGKYSHISQIESLYKASNESTNYVLNSKGKEVFKTDDYKFDLDESSDDSNMYKATLSNAIILFDYNGKKIDEINSNSKTSYSDLRCKDLFCEMFIDNKTYIYNLDEGKRIITLDGENYINTHKGDIISVYLKNNKYNVYKNDKLILDGVEASNGLDILDDGFAARNSTYTLYDKAGNVVNDTVFFYKDTKNYLKKDDYTKSTYSFYKDGKLSKKDDTLVSLFSNNDTSLQNNYDNSLIIMSSKKQIPCYDNSTCYGYNFYDFSGNAVNKTSYVKLKTGYSDYMLVSEDGKKEYIINKKFEKVSDDYDSNSIFSIITNDKKIHFWQVYKDGKYMLLAENGKVLKENIIEKVFVSSSIPSNIIQLKYDDKVELYNIKEKKVVVTLDKNVTFNSYNDLYINVTENGVNNFYSYINGKKFYSK